MSIPFKMPNQVVFQATLHQKKQRRNTTQSMLATIEPRMVHSNPDTTTIQSGTTSTRNTTFTDEQMLLHHTLMYSKPSLVNEYTGRIEEMRAKADQLDQKVRLSCILVGVMLLQADFDRASQFMEEVQTIFEENEDAFLTEEGELFAEAVSLWYHGDINAALDVHNDLFEKYPHNLWSLYFGYQHAIVLYRLNWLCDVFDNHIMKVFPLCSTSPKVYHKENEEFDFFYGHYVKGMYCLVLGEMERFEEAEKVGLEAEEHFNEFKKYAQRKLGPNQIFKCPWVHHSLCHVYHMTGRFTEGINYMEARRKIWHSCNAFLQTHNYWHLCLLYIARNSNKTDASMAMQQYHNHLWIERSADEVSTPTSSTDTEQMDCSGDTPSWKEDPSVHIAAINFLMKVDLDYMQEQYKKEPKNLQISVADSRYDDLWEEVTEASIDCFDKHWSAYFDFHYAYLIARNLSKGKEVVATITTFLEGLELQRQFQKPYISTIYENMVIPICKGLFAYFERRFDEAYTEMSSVFKQPKTKENVGDRNFRHNGIGGSFAQREVLDEIWCQILVETKKYSELEQFLRERGDFHCVDQQNRTTGPSLSYCSQVQLERARAVANNNIVKL